jgi:hypothetical protein
MTTCARFARCSWRGARTSGRCIARGHGEVRRAWVVVACLGYSRAGTGALVFSKEAPDVLWGMARCLWSLGALPELFSRPETAPKVASIHPRFLSIEPLRCR